MALVSVPSSPICSWFNARPRSVLLCSLTCLSLYCCHHRTWSVGGHCAHHILTRRLFRNGFLTDNHFFRSFVFQGIFRHCTACFWSCTRKRHRPTYQHNFQKDLMKSQRGGSPKPRKSIWSLSNTTGWVSGKGRQYDSGWIEMLCYPHKASTDLLDV